ncbi:MAG: c-type cytochrome, partial [Myxococcota bacterium]|nr:c-type cytochrome [Myxococcota bacterium]
MRKVLLAAAALGVASTVAWAFPWDTDMVDAVYKRAYAWKMAPLPEGVVSVNHSRIPGDRLAPETADMEIPTGRNLTEGKRLFDNYCTACHGVDGLGG